MGVADLLGAGLAAQLGQRWQVVAFSKAEVKFEIQSSDFSQKFI